MTVAALAPARPAPTLDFSLIRRGFGYFAGICEVVAYEQDFAEPRWGAEYKVAQAMFAEAAVTVRCIARLKELQIGS